MPPLPGLAPCNPTISLLFLSCSKGLVETGYVEGRNLTIEDASAEDHPEQFPVRAVDAVRKHVSLIAAVSGLPSIAAAKAATMTIPIVFISIGDPVELGLVAVRGWPQRRRAIGKMRPAGAWPSPDLVI